MSSGFECSRIFRSDITDRFDLDTGQRDNFYDIGRIKLKLVQLLPYWTITC